MKKLLLTILSSSLVMAASEEVYPESYSEEMMTETMALPERVNMGWRDMAMAHWQGLSQMAQWVVLIVVALLVLYVISRIVRCGNGCRCGSGKNAHCDCNVKH